MSNCTVIRGERVTNGFPPRKEVEKNLSMPDYCKMEYSTAVTKLYGVAFACLPVYVVIFFVPGNFIRWPAPLYNFIPEQII